MASGRPEDEVDPRDERTAQPGDGAPGRTDRFDDERADPTAADRLHDPARWEAAEHGGERGEHGDVAAVTAGAAGYGSAEPTMVDPDSRTDTRDTALTAAGVGAAGAPAALPAEPATLLDADMAQGFRDRWRDVQLRFVDDPREAAGEAQHLVEEAIRRSPPRSPRRRTSWAAGRTPAPRTPSSCARRYASTATSWTASSDAEHRSGRPGRTPTGAPSRLHQAQGVRINLWAGLTTPAFGLLFLLRRWWLAPGGAPLRPSGTTPSRGVPGGGCPPSSAWRAPCRVRGDSNAPGGQQDDGS
jgi:hypothetical protein